MRNLIQTGLIQTGLEPQLQGIELPGLASRRSTPVTQALARSSPKPVRTSRPPRKPAPPAPVSNAKKGVAAWAFTGAGQALTQSRASWYYTWSASPAVGVSSAGGPRFVPLIWGAANVNASTLRQVRGEGPDLLSFNEPDMSGQANMSPA